MKHDKNQEPEKWREDFPTQSERDDHITRRDFTRFLLLISAGFATGNDAFQVRARKFFTNRFAVGGHISTSDDGDGFGANVSWRF